MTLREALKQAIETQDRHLLFVTLNSLLHGCNYSHEEITNMVVADCNVTSEDFEVLTNELKENT